MKEKTETAGRGTGATRKPGKIRATSACDKRCGGVFPQRGRHALSGVALLGNTDGTPQHREEYPEDLWQSSDSERVITDVIADNC
jgi:hypothetical protein